MTSESVVRQAMPEDREGIIGLIHLLHEENGLFPLSDEKVQVWVDRYYMRDAVMIGVIGALGAVEGAIFLSIDNPYYSDAYQVSELFNVVHPDHRASKHARSLIEYAKMCSNELKIPLVVGVMSNHRTAAKIRLYERQLKPAGAFFVHNAHLGGTQWAEAAE